MAADESKNQKPATAQHASTPVQPTSIPVAILILKPETAARLTGAHALSGDAIKACTDVGRKQVSITFTPQMRHLRVEVTEPGGKPPRVAYIHESNVAYWEPVLQ